MFSNESNGFAILSTGDARFGVNIACLPIILTLKLLEDFDADVGAVSILSRKSVSVLSRKAYESNNGTTKFKK